MIRFFKIAILLIAGLLLSTGSLSGQPAHNLLDERGRNVQENIQTVKKWKLVETLNLTEEQTTKLFPRINEVDKARQDFHHGHRQLVDDLEHMLKKGQPSDNELIAKMNEIDALKKAHEDEIRDLEAKVKEVLTVEQQAKWVLFEIKFEDYVRRVSRDLIKKRIDPNQ